jgi:hypothetical protein
MTHWGWYWKVKRKHKRKALCSWFTFSEIDSFDMYKNQQLVQFVRESKDHVSLIIPQYNLRATLLENDDLHVVYNNGSYIIPVEKKPCNFGGFYHFFHCPQCGRRMRKLYCIEGRYLCRKCANLGYLSQRLRPSERHHYMKDKVVTTLQNHAGTLDRKPPWIHKPTFHRLRKKYVNHDEKYFHARHEEMRAWYGPQVEAYMDTFYGFFVPDGLGNVYDPDKTCPDYRKPF